MTASVREGERLLNRELSWLDFNARILDLAEDRSVRARFRPRVESARRAR